MAAAAGSLQLSHELGICKSHVCNNQLLVKMFIFNHGYSLIYRLMFLIFFMFCHDVLLLQNVTGGCKSKFLGSNFAPLVLVPFLFVFQVYILPCWWGSLLFWDKLVQ